MYGKLQVMIALILLRKRGAREFGHVRVNEQIRYAKITKASAVTGDHPWTTVFSQRYAHLLFVAHLPVWTFSQFQT